MKSEPRAYTVYKDEAGQYFAEFDDMIECGFHPATAKGKLIAIETGFVNSCVELFRIERKYIKNNCL